jgi:protein-disulfide isomerase
MRISVIFTLFLISSSILAAEPSSNPPSTTEVKIPAAVTEAVQSLFKEHFQIAPSPIDGFYEVVVEGKDILYLTQDGVHIVSGNIYQIKPRENLTDKRRTELAEAFKPKRKELIDSVPETEMVVFSLPKVKRNILSMYSPMSIVAIVPKSIWKSPN